MTKGDQSWVLIGRTDAKAEASILWPLHAKSWLIGKDSDARRIWGRRRRQWQRMRWLDASLTWWTWVWVDSGCWWWTGKTGVLRFMGSQRVRHNRASELNWSCTRSYRIILVISIKDKRVKWLLTSFFSATVIVNSLSKLTVSYSRKYTHSKKYGNPQNPF